MVYRVLIMSLFLVIAAPVYTSAVSQEEHNLWRVLKPASPDRFLIYEVTIVPWLQREFAKKVFVYSGSTVKRGLVRSDLLRYENIEGQERYNVHIEYRVFIRDVSGVEITGLKGQEIVFWVHNNLVRDYFPFEEYWIERAVLQEEDFY